MPTLRSTAAGAALIGAVCSLALMLQVGRGQKSILLLILFTGWVLSPFVAIAAANFRSNRWPRPGALHRTTLVVTLASIAIYSYAAFGPPIAKPAFIFLMVPLSSWLLLAIVFVAARRSSR
jgi:hypothetical protein